MIQKMDLTPRDMQQATHPRLHVRNTLDAHTVFEAVRQGFLRPVTRRLNEIERSLHVRSGAVFVWEECDDENGLKRWTDGRIWGQSRMREPYLFYDEKVVSDGLSQPLDQSNNSITFRFVDSMSRNGPSSSALLHQDRSGGQHLGLVKQAYSAWVSVSPNSRPRKWHLTAYFTYADLPSIPTIDQDPLLSKIIIPASIYRAGKARSRNDSNPPERVNGMDYQDGHLNEMVPVLPPLHLTVGPYISTGRPQPRSQLHQHGRIPEDQRVIQMLNSRYVS